MLKDSLPDIYEFISPENSLPLVFDSPHSGTCYPADFDYACDFETLDGMVDRYVDDLFSAAPDCGAAFLRALFPRSYIEPNRADNDIDPDMLSSPWPEPLSTEGRARKGAGLLWRAAKAGVPIYSKRLSPDTVKNRIDNYYRPYHNKLQEALDKVYEFNGAVWHVNCHSMPSRNHGPLPDIVLGDFNGVSCAPEFLNFVRNIFKDMGYTTGINHPYRGGELVTRYSNPRLNRHSLQIEINRALYMNETTKEKSKNYSRIKNDLESFTRRLGDYVQNRLVPLAAD
ncbi:MAG: N-formylglutamate amidohydrolase [Rhodospirillales bacterium]|nr:N-formylglutamate amidohydrolase [Rhodospirillales bacterium]